MTFHDFTAMEFQHTRTHTHTHTHIHTEYIQRRNLDQCSHHCLAKPDGLLFTLTMGLPDGTTCIFTAPPSPSLSLDHAPVPESVGVCVGGECVPVGCDKTLHSMAVRDPCGVWCGNGSTCVPVSDTYTIPPEAITDTSKSEKNPEIVFQKIN